jgi:hypothetical protein
LLIGVPALWDSTFFSTSEVTTLPCLGPQTTVTTQRPWAMFQGEIPSLASFSFVNRGLLSANGDPVLVIKDILCLEFASL